MRSLLVLLILISSSYQQDSDYEVLNQIFTNQENEVDNSQCDPIVGPVKSCLECYTCDHPAISRYRNTGTQIQELSLKKTKSCDDRSTVCCIARENLAQRQKDTDNCGRRVETRGRRSGPKSILQKEIPWHVHVYSTNGPRKLCAGAYISLQKGGILVPASCVRGKNGRDLKVSFNTPSDTRNLADVASVKVHEQYDANSNTYNLALLRLSTPTAVPYWLKPVCLPDRAPLAPLPCMSFTDKDYYVNSVIPQNCADRISSSSQMCTVGIPGDYTPEFGAGLICEIQDSKELIYELHGIHLSSKDSFGTYTNISYLISWIDRQFT